jgi:hypothetical protein
MADWGVGQKPLLIAADGGGLWSALGRDGGYRAHGSARRDPEGPRRRVLPARGVSTMLLESPLTLAPSMAVATVQVLVNQGSRPINFDTGLNRTTTYLMGNLNSDSASRNVHLSSDRWRLMPSEWRKMW